MTFEEVRLDLDTINCSISIHLHNCITIESVCLHEKKNLQIGCHHKFMATEKSTSCDLAINFWIHLNPSLFNVMLMIYSFIMFIQCSNSAVALWAPGIDMLHLTDLGDLADALGYKQMWKNPAFPRKIIYRWVFQTWVFRRVLCWQEETAYERDDILALCNGIKTPPCLSPASFNHRIAACEKTLHRPRPKKRKNMKTPFRFGSRSVSK